MGYGVHPCLSWAGMTQHTSLLVPFREGGTQLFSGWGVQPRFPKCGTCELMLSLKAGSWLLWTEIFKFGGLRAKILAKTETAEAQISQFKGVFWTDFLSSFAWNGTLANYSLRGVKKGIFRATHPCTPFLGQCPPPQGFHYKPDMGLAQILNLLHPVSYILQNFALHIIGADLEGGGAAGTRPLYFFFSEIRCLILCGRPRYFLKRMNQIMRIDFENYNISPLLKGHIPLRHPLSPHAPKFCETLIWAPPLLKYPGSAPVLHMLQIATQATLFSILSRTCEHLLCDTNFIQSLKT